MGIEVLLALSEEFCNLRFSPDSLFSQNQDNTNDILNGNIKFEFLKKNLNIDQTPESGECGTNSWLLQGGTQVTIKILKY